MSDPVLAAIARTTRFLSGQTRRCSALDLMLERGAFSKRTLLVPPAEWMKLHLWRRQVEEDTARQMALIQFPARFGR